MLNPPPPPKNNTLITQLPPSYITQTCHIQPGAHKSLSPPPKPTGPTVTDQVTDQSSLAASKWGRGCDLAHLPARPPPRQPPTVIRGLREEMTASGRNQTEWAKWVSNSPTPTPQHRSQHWLFTLHLWLALQLNPLHTQKASLVWSLRGRTQHLSVKITRRCSARKQYQRLTKVIFGVTKCTCESRVVQPFHSQEKLQLASAMVRI